MVSAMRKPEICLTDGKSNTEKPIPWKVQKIFTMFSSPWKAHPKKNSLKTDADYVTYRLNTYWKRKMPTNSGRGRGRRGKQSGGYLRGRGMTLHLWSGQLNESERSNSLSAY